MVSFLSLNGNKNLQFIDTHPEEIFLLKTVGHHLSANV